MLLVGMYAVMMFMFKSDGDCWMEYTICRHQLDVFKMCVCIEQREREWRRERPHNEWTDRAIRWMHTRLRQDIFTGVCETKAAIEHRADRRISRSYAWFGSWWSRRIAFSGRFSVLSRSTRRLFVVIAVWYLYLLALIFIIMTVIICCSNNCVCIYCNSRSVRSLSPPHFLPKDILIYYLHNL